MTRRLIVCSDGTWNTPEKKDRGVFAPSNVVKMARASLPLSPDGTPQILFYDPGVGTGNVLDKYSGGIFGIGLSQNVKDAYRFLMDNHVEGDDIYLFGFSRGAYTVRSAAGFISKCGLLHKQHADRVSEAFALYRERDEEPSTEKAKLFRERFSRTIRIKFIGVWDTVGALGVPISLRPFSKGRHEFHDVSLSRSVDYAYQALAIDERRPFFKPTLWEQHPGATGQTMEQAWFAGVHMDVGGGHNESSLSDSALIWMKEKAEATGLAFDESYLAGLRPDPLTRLHESRSFPYNLFPPHERSIGGRPTARETVHPSAMERYRQIPSYRPSNLCRFLDRQGKR